MHIGRQQGRHATIIGRSTAHEDIEARDPSLINLPIPLPSIPILNPLIAPLIGGSNQAKTTSTKTPTSTPTTAPAPSTPSPSPSPSPSSSPSGGSSGGSTGGGSTGSGGSSSGDSGSSGGSSGDSSGSGDSGSSSGGSDTSGSTGGGNTDTPGGTSQPSGVSNTDSSSPSPTQSESDPASPSGTASTGGTGTGGGTDLSASGNLGNTDTTGASSSNESSGSGSGSSGTANAGGLPGNGSGDSSSSGSPSGSVSIGSNGLPVSTSVSGGSGNTGDGNNTGNSVEGSSKPRTSTGVIVAIVLVLLLFLVILALGIRRRNRARRNDRANKWWFTKKRTSQTYGDRNSTEIIMPGAGARSARSSFATTVDHSISPHHPDFIIPPLPPMAEVGRTDGRTPTLVIDVDPARFSIGSTGSNDSQYLVVTHRDSMTTEMAGTPMSVRPFSPSESYAFPKPPDPAGERSSTAYSGRSSVTVSNKSPVSSPHNSHVEIIPPIPPTPTFPPPVLVSPNPFGADSVANPFADNNPFEDTPTPTSASATASIPTPSPILAPPLAVGSFAEVEYIRRPFNPSLTDELQVTPDDGVHVLQTFDDGWALVEKVSTADGNGKARHGNYGKGLIPVDCLREPGQTLPSFFAVKRVSTYNYAESTRTVSSESPFAFSAF